ncbi:hypothetical protein [Ktedonosporobacter rubrisoli]|uniref:hypothetical protein n=1 Tax=Ktedonosporobacter rubrisoli TaxID=2509675 RepID=UPI0013EE945C|nr:hypothetical protein [Ktedonosporobacter rubrisoli]
MCSDCGDLSTRVQAMALWVGRKQVMRWRVKRMKDLELDICRLISQVAIMYIT